MPALSWHELSPMYSNELFLLLNEWLTGIWSCYERITFFWIFSSLAIRQFWFCFHFTATMPDIESCLHYWVQKRIYMERLKEQCVIELGIYGDVQAFDIWWFASIFFVVICYRKEDEVGHFCWQQGNVWIVSTVQQLMFSVCWAVARDMYLLFSCENPVLTNCSSQTYSDSQVKSAATLIVLQEVACVITYKDDLRKIIEWQGVALLCSMLKVCWRSYRLGFET